MSKSNPIPIEKAIELCKEYREKHKVRMFSQCWGCLKFSKEPNKMCFSNPPENRGCKYVNELFDFQSWRACDQRVLKEFTKTSCGARKYLPCLINDWWRILSSTKICSTCSGLWDLWNFRKVNESQSNQPIFSNFAYRRV